MVVVALNGIWIRLRLHCREQPTRVIGLIDGPDRPACTRTVGVRAMLRAMQGARLGRCHVWKLVVWML